MKSYLNLIPISARVHKRQNRMTRLCIIFAVFMVTAVFSMAEMGTRMELDRLSDKHQGFSLQDILSSTMGQSLFLAAAVLFVLILIAGVLMILRHDALHRHEPAADYPFRAAGGPELVQNRGARRPYPGHPGQLDDVRGSPLSRR